MPSAPLRIAAAASAVIGISMLTFAPIGVARAQRGRPPEPNYDAFYELGPDSLVRRGVPKGKVTGPFKLATEVFPGVEHDVRVYVPAQYDGSTEVSLMVFNDGATYLQPDGYYRAVNVLDNLIYRGDIPVMIAAFIDPGKVAADGTSVRQEQYDPINDRYARVIVDELLPRLYADYNVSHDPDRHGIAGWSSGAIAAFTVAWQRPDAFHKVLSGIGTFVDLAGGYVYPETVRASDKKPIRIFMIDGRNDNRGLGPEGEYDANRDWFYQNVRLKDALVEKGYDVNYSWGMGVHSHDMGGAMLPEMMRWLWRDQPVSTDPRDTVERSFREAAASSQNGYSNPDMTPINDRPNPYAAREIMPLPDARSWGSTAGVDAAKGHDDVWAIDRCGSNGCVGSNLDPLMHYDAAGNLIGHMGANLFAFPHGIFVDEQGNVWVTDPLPPDGRGAGGDVGQQVTKLSPDGEILLQLGTRKVSGNGPDQFSSPSDVVVGRDGDIFVADGHGEGTNERIMKFDGDGNFIKAWGKPGNGPCGAGEFSSLHALAIDSQGRLFIGDRDNNRIQIYDQDGVYLECWYQFSRPSGIYIDGDDNLFVTDSESRDGANDGLDLAHPGWQRGIRIGSARDGTVRYFIPDPDPQGGSSTSEGVAAIGGGAVVYGAEVGPRALVRYVRK